jgi:3-deoxy-D-manno-octulosonic-acid transferase
VKLFSQKPSEQMLWLYNTGLFLYGLLIRLAALWNAKAKKMLAGRQRTFASLRNSFSGNSNQPLAWFHCASLGEFEQGRPVIEAFRQTYPQYRILLTFYSPSGYEIRKNYPLADAVCYLPHDTAANARQFICLSQPSVAFFVKYEFWYHYLNELQKQGIPALCFSAIFRYDQLFFRWYGAFYRNMLSMLDHIFVQDERSVQLLAHIGQHHASVAGDTRFDRVLSIAQENRVLPEIELFAGQARLIIAGSTWPDDLEVLHLAWEKVAGLCKLIVVPHETDEQHLRQIENHFSKHKLIRYSQIVQNASLASDTDILLVDTIGMLSALYRYGTLAYVGGAFGDGLHNILEAAVFGLPVFFGDRNYKKFAEANQLIEIGGAFAIPDATTLGSRWENLLNNPELLMQLSLTNQRFVENGAGSSGKIISYCQHVLQL